MAAPHNQHDDLNFEIANFPFLHGDVPRSASLGLYNLLISDIYCVIRFV